MKYTKLILSGYKRLAIKSIHYFEINPTSTVQLILGTNGSGKSSLISELSPLPGNGSDFTKDGFKEIHIEHNGDSYVLKSLFSPKQEHSIVKNNCENLNPGGTITVQKEIVSQLFGYTQDIHEIITFRERFTLMSPSSRRFWFTKLSNTNYDYAIRVYNKLKEKYRDISGTIKTLKKRLVQETEKIVDIDFQNRLEKEVDELHKFISMMLENRKPLEETKEDIKKLEDELYCQITTVSKSLITLSRNNPGIGFISFEELNDSIAKVAGSVRANEHLSNKLITEIEDIDQSIGALEKTQGSNIEDLTSKLLNLQLREAALLKELKYQFNDSVHYQTYYEAASSISEAINSCASTIVANPDKYYSRITYQKTLDEIETLNKDRLALQNDLTALQAKKQHQELHRDSPAVQCPKCTHKWHLNYSEDSYNVILDSIAKHETALNRIEDKITNAKELVNQIQVYFQNFNNYLQLTKTLSILNPLWDAINKSELLFQNPIGILNIFNDFNNAIFIKKELDELKLEIKNVIELISLAKAVGEQDLSKLKSIREVKEAELYNIAQSSNALKIEGSNLKRLVDNKKTVESLKANLQKLLETSEDIYNRTNEAIRRELYNDCVRTVQTALSRKELAISEIRGQRSIINDIKNQITLLETDEASLKLLVNELSPTDGLIAEGMLGFIKTFTKQMNYFISKVWSYNMVIQACNIEDLEKVDLDYKFPVEIPGNAGLVPDVSRCSTGQQEIINLAFVVLTMKQLGLGSSPIMLDEFAANLDNTHRLAAIGVVKSLIEQHSFSQLYMVNHYDGIYGAFTNAQVTVLCDENIILPRDCVYNKHVVIK